MVLLVLLDCQQLAVSMTLQLPTLHQKLKPWPQLHVTTHNASNMYNIQLIIFQYAVFSAAFFVSSAMWSVMQLGFQLQPWFLQSAQSDHPSFAALVRGMQDAFTSDSIKAFAQYVTGMHASSLLSKGMLGVSGLFRVWGLGLWVPQTCDNPWVSETANPAVYQ